MRENTVLRAWQAGGQTIGAWLTFDGAFSAEVLAHLSQGRPGAGFDWLCIDLQHGLSDTATLQAALRAMAGTPVIPIVRVPWNDPALIMQALDAGALGIVVPLVNDAGEAARAVAACRYPPLGIRSAGPVRARIAHGADYVERANDEVACIVMIETAEALERLDEILAVPGVDAAYIGPADLAAALGLPIHGDHDDPRHAAEVGRILAACRRHGVAPGIHTGSVAFTRKYLEMGFQMVTLGSDEGFMVRQAAGDLAAVRGAAPGPTHADA